jgi:hypothetical protein
VKQALALPDPKINIVGLLEMMTEELPIPEVLIISEFQGAATQIPANGLQLPFSQDGRPPTAGRLLQPCKTTVVEPPNPVLDGARTLVKELCHFITVQPAADEQQPMESMIVTGVLGSRDFLLDGDPHDLRIRDLQFAHGPLLGQNTTKIHQGEIIRNNL